MRILLIVYELGTWGIQAYLLSVRSVSNIVPQTSPVYNVKRKAVKKFKGKPSPFIKMITLVKVRRNDVKNHLTHLQNDALLYVHYVFMKKD